MATHKAGGTLLRRKTLALQPVHEASFDQEPVEAAGFRAVLAGIK
jgi:hypothetical protein